MLKKMQTSTIAGMVLALVTSLTPPSAVAADKRPVPASAVQTTDGATLTLDRSAGTESRVYIYVLPDSQVSGRLLSALRTWPLAAPDRVTIVVGGDVAKARAFATADHGLAVQWLVDAERAVWTDLEVAGVPTLLGVRNGIVEWRLAGVLNNPSALQNVVSGWVDGPR